MYNWFSNNVALRLSDLMTGKNISCYLEYLNESQYWSENKIAEFQNAKLQGLLKHSYENVSFYKNLFDLYGIVQSQIQDISDLKKIPILTKGELRGAVNSGELIDNTTDIRRFEKNNSSGSTGEPFCFYLNKDASSIRKASVIRAWQWMGFNLGDKILRVSPLERTGIIKQIQDVVTKTYYVQAYKLDEAEFSRISDAINKHKPIILRSYPDPLYLLARYIRENNVNLPQIKAINTTGSTLHNVYREYIEDVFNCRIYDSFSCEGGAVASQCSESSLYHLADEYAITEVVDDSGNPTNKGRLITTDLWNYATPFLRYDTQDVVEISEQNCSCTRGLSVIKQIYGRASDVLVTSSKQYLFVNNFTGHFQNLLGIDQYQIHQKSIDEFEVKIKPNEQYADSVKDAILGLMKEIIGDDANVAVSLHEEIPVLKSGKRRFLIRDESVPLGI